MKTPTKTATLSLIGMCLLSACAGSGAMQGTGNGSVAMNEKPARMANGHVSYNPQDNTSPYMAP